MSQAEEKLILEVSKYEELYDTANTFYKDSERRSNIWKAIGNALERPAEHCTKKWKNMRDAFVAWRKKSKSKKSGQAAKKVKDYRYAKELEFLIPFTNKRKTSSNLPSSCEDISMPCEGSSSEEETQATQEFEDEIITGTVCMENDSNICNTNANVELSAMDSLDTTLLIPSCSSAVGQKRPSDGIDVIPKEKKRKEGMGSLVNVVRERQKERDKRRNSRLQLCQPQMDEVEMFFNSIAQTVKRLPPEVQAQIKLKICQDVMKADMEYQHRDVLHEKEENATQNCTPRQIQFTENPLSCHDYPFANIFLSLSNNSS